MKKTQTGGNEKTIKCIVEELDDYGANNLTREMKTARENTYLEAFSLPMLLEDKDDEEYGEEVHNYFYNKTAEQLRSDYENNAGIMVLTDSDESCASMAVVQVLMECKLMAACLLITDFDASM